MTSVGLVKVLGRLRRDLFVILVGCLWSGCRSGVGDVVVTCRGWALLTTHVVTDS